MSNKDDVEETCGKVLRKAGESLHFFGLCDTLFDPLEPDSVEIKFMRRKIYRDLIGPLRKLNRECKLGPNQTKLLVYLLDITKGPAKWMDSAKQGDHDKTDARESYRRLYERDLRFAYKKFKEMCGAVFLNRNLYILVTRWRSKFFLVSATTRWVYMRETSLTKLNIYG